MIPKVPISVSTQAANAMPPVAHPDTGGSGRESRSVMTAP